MKRVAKKETPKNRANERCDKGLNKVVEDERMLMKRDAVVLAR